MLTFTGANEHRVTFAANPFPTIQSTKSISYWFYYSSAPGGNQNHIQFNNGSNAALQIGTRGADLIAWGWGGVNYVSVAAPAASAWHWLGYTYDGTYHTLYLDGSQAAQTTNAVQSGTAVSARLGYGEAGFPETFNGSLDDVRLYDTALTGNVITSIYNMKGGDPVYGDLLSRWTFLEGAPGDITVATSGAIKDLGPNSNNGTASGTTGRPVYGESFLKKHRRVLAYTAG